MTKYLFAIFVCLLALAACKESEPEPIVPTDSDWPEIVLTAPDDDVTYDLNRMSTALSFGWTEVESINSYRLQFSLEPDFEVLESVSAGNTPMEMGIGELDEVLGLLGLPEGKGAYLYWRVAPLRSNEFKCEARRILIERLDPNQRVIAPADGMRYNLDTPNSSISFEWQSDFEAQNYIIQFSLDSRFGKFIEPYKLGADKRRLSLSASALDGVAGDLGCAINSVCKIYWRVQPTNSKGNLEAYPIRSIVVERKYPYIKTIAPEMGCTVKLEDIQGVEFSWERSGLAAFFLELSMSKEFELVEQIEVYNANKHTVSAEEIGKLLTTASVKPGSDGVVYWRVAPHNTAIILPSETQLLIVRNIDNAVQLTSPYNGANFSCNATDEILFEWKAVDGIEDYDIEFSLDNDFSNKQIYNLDDGENNPTAEYISTEYLDLMLQNFGVEAESTAKVYWRVIPNGSHDKEIAVRHFTLERMDPYYLLPYEERISDKKMTIYVEALIEDPIVYHEGVCTLEEGKLLHEVTTIRGDKWNDPMVQIYELEESLEEAAHGLIDFKITKVHHLKDICEPNELPFSYLINDSGEPILDENGNKTYLNYAQVLQWCRDDSVPGLGKQVAYDYIKMLTDSRLATDGMTIAERVDAGLVQEVWVYGHPCAGMYESRLVGDGAFWCNSPGLTKEMGAPNTKLLAVMAGTYERTTDLAIHCFGHRYESIMNYVYGRFDQDYEGINKESQLNNWQRFCGYVGNYGNGKFHGQEGYAHIGFCHFPPNASGDYDYDSKRYAYTYADEWLYYPRLPLNKRKARRVNCEEWKHKSGYGQWGYMIWYLGHMPHFKGLNMADGHLNNWWYYMVDVFGALEYEKQLREELGWKAK